MVFNLLGHLWLASKWRKKENNEVVLMERSGTYGLASLPTSIKVKCENPCLLCTTCSSAYVASLVLNITLASILFEFSLMPDGRTFFYKIATQDYVKGSTLDGIRPENVFIRGGSSPHLTSRFCRG
jgi:hypothetical protein